MQSINSKSTEEIQLKSEAIKQHRKGNIKKAEKLYKEMLSNGIIDLEIVDNLAIILKDHKKNKEAITIYKKAILIYAKEASLYSNLGNILMGIGYLDKAKRSIIKALSYNENLPNALLNMTFIHKAKGDLIAAEKIALSLIKIDPDNASGQMNMGSILMSQGKIEEALIYAKKAIKLNPHMADAYMNLGAILGELGDYDNSEINLRKSISIGGNVSLGFLNLGSIYKSKGDLRKAKAYIEKAIEINPLFARAHFKYSTLNGHSKNDKFKKLLFNLNTSTLNSSQEKIDIVFSKANYFHQIKDYKNSSIMLAEANSIKRKLYGTDLNDIINLSNNLLSITKEVKKLIPSDGCRNMFLFIVGMPRSGSTLIETILSRNEKVIDMGETRFLANSVSEWISNLEENNSTSLVDKYKRFIGKKYEQHAIYTDKQLYNYMYTGIICNQFKNGRIIYCKRNPLDNILSIYRAHFSNGNLFSSSVSECADLIIHQEKIMNTYISNYPEKIYDLNYEQLVKEPRQELNRLFSWLNWNWDEKYLSPHLSNRFVMTASSAAIRAPINTKSIDGWKNYQIILEPAIQRLKDSGMNIPN